ncbi:glycoside hydrolase family 3 protein [Agromyces sp. ISL-38]|uniref:beta-glucosidase n=1 Tax=Agromyces sp. ISL-38 TaxID=2819107 RepID=UPI001BE8955E|nr:glycoside hydrolase family 3 C-terminal domain-containing protein [Agromyces sp. ISL-38]MBT2498590.1 glycoside hydrolase family 3 protein [Agromyces sp. ISL-38]
MTDMTANTVHDTEIDSALAALTLEEKVLILTGQDFWSTPAIERIGLRSMVLSDGPSGVRGPVWDERSPSLNLPSASALSAAFDPALAHRYGAVAAVEARRKGVDVVLGPTVNLHRSPRGGRHFEAFSEDPVLTGELAAAYVNGLQDNGVAATPKHFVANDSETDRFTVDVKVGDRALRELYLLAFEKAIVEAKAWLVMSAYNSINGITATENDLLEAPLNSDWGFDGVVVSDWTAVRSLASATASQDLVMPGPDGPWGAALVAAVTDGSIDEAAIDRKVRRLLHLAIRVGALGDHGPALLVHVEDGLAFARTASAEGTVLLENKRELPWNSNELASIAVIGNNADVVRTQGGGSATVLPERTVSPLEGLRNALPHTPVTYSLGAVNQVGLAGIPREQMTNPVTGEQGLRVSFRNGAGEEIFHEDRLSTELVWFGESAPIRQAREVELAFSYVPSRTERLDLGFAATGHGRFWLNGELVIDEVMVPESDDLGAAFLSPSTSSVAVDLVEGTPVDIRFVYACPELDGALAGALPLSVGTRPTSTDEDALIAEAAEAARTSTVALVVVGTNARVESEGLDRESLALPGRQDDLVRAVVAANPRTVVLVNAGSPVLMPWRNDVAAVLVGWFGGQEFGDAIADVLLGLAEPGGRLPTTWPALESDVPVLDTIPVDGTLAYDEGIHIGYRAWLRTGATPAYWFGHGLGYTDIAITEVSAPTSALAGESVEVSATVTNTGAREGKHVVQVFAERPDSSVDRAARWLVGFAPVRVPAGASATVSVTVPTRMLAHWGEGWEYEPGVFTLRVGTTAVDLPFSAQLSVQTAS